MTPLDPFPAALQCWQNFYILAGTAAATLVGLMFVAVTFGSSLVTKESADMARAFLDPTYRHFTQVLFTACVLTIPTLGPSLLGALLMIVAAARLLGLPWIFRRLLRAHRKQGDLELSDWVSSVVLPFAVHLLLLATGAAFILGKAVALTGLAIGMVMLLLLGMYGAWETVVWMALAVGERRQAQLPAPTAPSATVAGGPPEPKAVATITIAGGPPEPKAVATISIAGAPPEPKAVATISIAGGPSGGEALPPKLEQ